MATPPPSNPKAPEPAAVSVDMAAIAKVGVEVYFAKPPKAPIKLFLKVPVDFNVPSLLEHIATKNAGYITSLLLERAGLVDDNLSILAQFSKLTELDLGVNWSLTPAAIAGLVSRLPLLQKLSLYWIDIRGRGGLVEALESSGGLQNLVQLNLSRNKAVSPAILDALLHRLPKLQALLLWDSNLTDEHMNVLNAAWERGLIHHTLNLQGNNAISDTALDKIPQTFGKTASNLNFDNVPPLNDAVITKWAKAALSGAAFQGLQHLSLNGNKEIQPESLGSFLAALPVIQDLELQDMQLTDDHIAQLAKVVRAGGLKTLQTLSLEGNEYVDTAKVMEVVKELPDLRKLSLVGMVIADKALQVFTKWNPKLTALDLRDSLFTPEALHYLLTTIPGLKNLNLQATQLSDAHISILTQACRNKLLDKLESLNIGGKQMYSSNALGELVQLLPPQFANLSFLKGDLQLAHIEALTRAVEGGAMANVRALEFGIGNSAVRRAPGGLDAVVALACLLPKLKSLGCYAFATNAMVQNVINKIQNNYLPNLTTINIMECSGITPETLGDLHAWLPQQGVGYFGLGLKDEHVHALARAATGQIRPNVFALQTHNMFNANGNGSLSPDGLALFLQILPAVSWVELSHGDLTTDKLLAIAALKRSGTALTKVGCLNIWFGKLANFSPDSLVELVEAFADTGTIRISHMSLTDDYVTALAASAEANKSFRKIKSFLLDVAAVTPNALTRILASLPRDSLTGLHLDGLVDAHLPAIYAAWREDCPRLKALGIKKSKITTLQPLLDLGIPAAIIQS